MTTTPTPARPLRTGAGPEQIPPGAEAEYDRLIHAVHAHRSTPCRSTTADLWFSSTPTDQQTAAAACADCPIRQPCADYALAAREPFGIWAGTTAADRRRTNRQATT